MFHFLEKARKIASALGTPPPTPVGLRRQGALLPDPQVFTPTQYKCDFRVLLKFLGIVKITT